MNIRPLHAFLFLAALAAAPACFAQQPFITDNSDVTDYHKWHFEFADEYDKLQPQNFPNLRQNTANFKFAYGLLHGVEIGLDNQLLTIENASSAPEQGLPQHASGYGDLDFSFKWNFHQEKKGSAIPAFAFSVGLEFPTGDARKQLGSGLTDVALNGILQKSIGEKVQVHVNQGYLLFGNTLTGVEGVRARGNVWTGGASIVRQLTHKLDLGVETVYALSTNFAISRGQVQAQLGGNYLLHKNLTLDFGFTGGYYSASPRVGGQLGFSIDW